MYPPMNEGHAAPPVPSFFPCFLITGLAVGLYYWLFTGRVPKQVILEADFEQGMIEAVSEDPLARVLSGKKPVLRDIVEALQKHRRTAGSRAWWPEWVRRR